MASPEQAEQKESKLWKFAKIFAVLAAVGIAIGVTVNYIDGAVAKW